MKEVLAKAGDQFKDVDKYLLKDYEHLSDDGEHIICDICGGVRYEKRYSKMFYRHYWAVTERPGRALVPVMTGCHCQQEARHRIAKLKDGDWQTVKDTKTNADKLTFVEGNLSDTKYNEKRYLFPVPMKYRTQWLESDRFWALKGEPLESYQRIRRMAESAMLEGEIPERNLMLFGSDTAIAMLCGVRNALLSYGFPTIYMDTKSALFHLSQHTPMATEMETVPVLILTFSEWLSETGKKLIAELMIQRKLGSTRHTFLGSDKPIEKLAETLGDGYLLTFSDWVDGDRNMMLVKQ